jgi:hypothetical protein
MTQCFTYEVKMTVQILAESEEDAAQKLDSQGGYLSPTGRITKLVGITNLTTPKLKSVPKPI